MKIIRWVLVALLVSSPVMAADFRLETTKSSPPFYQSPVPMAVYQQTHKSDLSDLTIKNAVGEQVPYALVPYTQLHPDTSNRIETIPLQFSPVKIGALQNPGELRLELEKTAGSTSVNVTSSDAKPVASTAYLIDLNTRASCKSKTNSEHQSSLSRQGMIFLHITTHHEVLVPKL